MPLTSDDQRCASKYRPKGEKYDPDINIGAGGCHHLVIVLESGVVGPVLVGKP